MDFTVELAGGTLEYIDSTHTYLFNGLVIPSITQILSKKFGHKYDNVRPDVLKNAAERGTRIHQAIQDFCESGTEDDSQELYNFKFLKKMYKFAVLKCEVPVVIFENKKPIAAGRLDLLLKNKNGAIEIGDIKTTSTLDKEYLAYQLNLYRIGYEQSYNATNQISGLKGIHLREEKRKYVDIPVNDTKIFELLKEVEK